MVTGSPLREFFAPSLAEYTGIATFASRLRVHIAKLLPAPASPHVMQSTIIFKDLVTASHVVLRQGSLQTALQAHYVGPYRVFHNAQKTYSIEVKGAATTVSIDRQKLAYCLHLNTESA
jgi:hypothetical protein